MSYINYFLPFSAPIPIPRGKHSPIITIGLIIMLIMKIFVAVVKKLKSKVWVEKKIKKKPLKCRS